MKANELMIGDWVLQRYYEGETEEGKKILSKGCPMKVSAIYDTVIQTEFPWLDERDERMYDEAELDELYGVPITSEILERNGFRKLLTYGTEKWVCDNFRLNVYDSGETWRFCADTNRNEDSVIYIRFVHELQHALRLCGIEKEIEL